MIEIIRYYGKLPESTSYSECLRVETEAVMGDAGRNWSLQKYTEAPAPQPTPEDAPAWLVASDYEDKTRTLWVLEQYNSGPDYYLAEAWVLTIEPTRDEVNAFLTGVKWARS